MELKKKVTKSLIIRIEEFKNDKISQINFFLLSLGIAGQNANGVLLHKPQLEENMKMKSFTQLLLLVKLEGRI